MTRAEALSAVQGVEGIRQYLAEQARNDPETRVLQPERERALTLRVLPLRRTLADLTPRPKVTVGGTPIARLKRERLIMECEAHHAFLLANLIVMSQPRPMAKLRGLVTLIDSGHSVHLTRTYSGVELSSDLTIDDAEGHIFSVLETPELFTCTDEDTIFYRGIEIAVLRIVDTPICWYKAVNNCADRRADDPSGGYAVRVTAIDRQRRRIDNVWRRGAPSEPVPGLRRPLPRTIEPA